MHITEVREDGIIISGMKAMICGVAASNEIFLLPGGAYREEDQDYAVSCVVPRDIKGLTIVEARRPSDTREMEGGFDIPDSGITQSFLFFKDCFVPNDRVFMCKESNIHGNIIGYFTANYRCVHRRMCRRSGRRDDRRCGAYGKDERIGSKHVCKQAGRDGC